MHLLFALQVKKGVENEDFFTSPEAVLAHFSASAELQDEYFNYLSNSSEDYSSKNNNSTTTTAKHCSTTGSSNATATNSSTGSRSKSSNSNKRKGVPSDVTADDGTANDDDAKAETAEHAQPKSKKPKRKSSDTQTGNDRHILLHMCAGHIITTCRLWHCLTALHAEYLDVQSNGRFTIK